MVTVSWSLEGTLRIKRLRRSFQGFMTVLNEFSGKYSPPGKRISLTLYLNSTLLYIVLLH